MFCVWPDLFSGGLQDHDPENKQNHEPDFPDHGGVALHFLQQPAQ